MNYKLFALLFLSTLLAPAAVFAGAPICADAIVNASDVEKDAPKAEARYVFLTEANLEARSKGDLLKYATVMDVADSKGSTFFTFLKDKVKPKLDEYATKGFKISDSKTISAALKNVSEKVRSGALKAAGSEENLLKIADTLAKSGKSYTLYDLPEAIAKTGVKSDRYGLSTFLALASGGGVAIRLTDCNYCYNVNYGTGKNAKDEMTGRSFGNGPGHFADDASDKSYLKELEALVRGGDKNPSDFYRNLLQVLTDCDPSGLSKVSDLGQTVAADFFAIYTAEADRHLMSDLKSHAWDVALLEVTLLSAFHGGQDKIKVMFNGKLVDKVPNQAPGGEPRTKIRDASLIDWWQFSSNPDPKSKNRSGINVTKKDFRLLGEVISDYERKNNKELVANVERHLEDCKTGGNVFEELSNFLINAKTKPQLGVVADKLSADMVAFLEQVRKDANKIGDEFNKSKAH